MRMGKVCLPREAACVIVAVVGLAACGGGGGGSATAAAAATPTRPAEETIAVRVAAAVREPISERYSTSATLRARRSAPVIARTRGVVRQLLVEEGDRVRAGSPLAVLEDDEQRIAAARARTARDAVVRERDRLATLAGQGLVSEDELEKLRRDAEDAEHALALAELELSRTVIRAPIDGVVVARHLDVGATVADGTAVVDIADVNPLEADVTIPERHVARLAPGQRVELTADATDRTVAARIDRIAPTVDAGTGTVKVTVAVEGGGDLRPGAFVRVDVVTATRDEALVVPRSALVAEGRRWHLYRLADSGETVEQLEVGLGFESRETVEITDTVGAAPLAAGDRVVVTGAPALSDGAAVTVVAEA